ncbi:hypothetical protein BN1708_009062 [Verticillium longisporum]|uniref:Uncharacterized protein n=1 Tax=Verticillium longisporum TaxID=100787 RepID=A0A0G4KDB8_VERLO|nr:hypothetical protein BN1708_009062 [Verticillium longisporum]
MAALIILWGKKSQEQEEEKDLYAPRNLLPVLAKVRNEIVGKETHERRQRDHLDAEAGEGNVHSGLDLVLLCADG